MDKLESLGWTVGDVEKHLRHSFVTQDLFGWCDVVAIKEGVGTLGLQVTDANWDTNKRVMKCIDEPRLVVCLRAGWMAEVWGVRDKEARDGTFALTRRFQLTHGGRRVTVYEGSDVL